jgi:hypothetical protein
MIKQYQGGDLNQKCALKRISIPDQEKPIQIFKEKKQ